jgi:hypothetical protein
MADEPNDQLDSSLPSPIIDKSSFPGGGTPMPGDSQSVPDESQKSQEQSDNSQIGPSSDDNVQSVLGDNTNVSQPAINSTGLDTPDIADDNDLIEKEWVNKAKSIIEKTKTNPHDQSDAMTLFKADYIKKRYNKTIKTSE